jgi:hypothetical protein
MVIAKLDSGHRGDVLSVAELLVLAAALNIPPVVLLYPGPYHREVEVLPGLMVSEFDAAQWISGLGYWGAAELDEPGADVESDDGREWVSHSRTLRLARELEGAERTRSLLLEHAKTDADRQQVAFYDSQIQWLRNELGRASDD